MLTSLLNQRDLALQKVEADSSLVADAPRDKRTVRNDKWSASGSAKAREQLLERR
jgi:hypothetical protein